MVYKPYLDVLTDCDPTVTHSNITAAGVINTKIKSICSPTCTHTATNYSVGCSCKLIGYAGKVNGRAPTVVDPSILSTHNRYIAVGNGSSGIPSQDTIGNIAINPQLVCTTCWNSKAIGVCTSGHCP